MLMGRTNDIDVDNMLSEILINNLCDDGYIGSSN